MVEPVVPPIIDLEHVTKRFRQTTVLRDISWQVSPGHIVGVLGRNGAGKTTLLRLVMGIVHPTQGQARMMGRNLLNNGPAIRQHVGFVAERSPIPVNFTPNRVEQLGRRVFSQWDRESYDAALRRFDIPRDKPGYLMSHGQRTMTGLAFALAHHADMLLFDKPINGLDPLVRRDFLSHLIKTSYDHGRTVLIASHRLEEIAQVAQDVVILDQGRLVASGAMEDLLDHDHIVSFRIGPDVKDVMTLPGARTVLDSYPHVSVYVENFQEDLIQTVLDQWRVKDWVHRPVSLEQFFEARVGSHHVG